MNKRRHSGEAALQTGGIPESQRVVFSIKKYLSLPFRSAASPERRRSGSPLFAILLLFTSAAWAGSDMSSPAYKIRRSDVNSGGSQQPASAHFQLTSSLGSTGGSLLQGATFFVFSGFSNLVTHPDSIEDLSAVTGQGAGELLLTFTAPVAYASTGTVSGYVVRTSSSLISTETDFVNATFRAVSWTPSLPGGIEIETLSALSPNTTYYVNVKGADRAGNTGYVSNSVGAATLTSALTGVQIVSVTTGSVTVSWTSLGAGNAEGYAIQASTAADFSGTLFNNSTLDTSATSLTIGGLKHGKRVYVRVGGVNWDSVSNYVVAGSTITLPGPAPTNPIISAVYLSSITVTWGGVSADDGYSADAFRDPGFTIPAGSSVTVNGAATGLALQGLTANTTYYLRVGSLYDDATNYAFTTPVATATLPAVPTSGVFSSVFPSSFTATWSGSINAAGTQYQIDISTVAAFVPVAQTATLTAFSSTFAGLIQGTTYWARVRALGWDGTNSAYLLIGSTMTPLASISGLTFSDVTASSAALAWFSQAAPEITFTAELAAMTGPGSVEMSSDTTGLFAAFSGLNPNLPYEARVRVNNIVTGAQSAWSSVISTYTLANAPVSLSTTALTTALVSLAWDGNGNPAGTLFHVERSTDGVVFAVVGAPLTVSYTDTTVSPDTTYWYRVQAFNGTGTPTVYSNTVLLTTPGSKTLPKRPYGFWAERSGTTVVYHWHSVMQRTDNSTLTNLAGYQVYASGDLFKPLAQWTLVATVPDANWTTTAGAGPMYYYLETVDLAGQVSAPSHVMDDTTDLTHYWLAPDGLSRIVMPQASAHVLRLERNQYSVDLDIQAQEIPQEETGRVVKSLRFDVVNVLTGEVVPDILFDPPEVQGFVTYTVENGQVIQGSPAFGQARVPLLSAAQASQQLSLFVYNGNDWVKTTGLVDSGHNALVFTGARAGRYQIRVASHSPGVTVTKVYPRIITPNGDGWNDKVVFQFDNPELLPLSGHMYDITGTKVADLKAGPQPDSTLIWDGKDSSGRVVPAGIYLYQIESAGSKMTGTVVVAR
jgi:hypothetical protein